ncbi:UNVERIFIED_CONTAM: hypothetical protein Sradi_0082800 [Sesamum radiatum]|uniref:Uncharacterized protein n=1 Tax=Sesamum radiatum TaxID=300843 RepID=A0AAW2WHS7_SESRA
MNLATLFLPLQGPDKGPINLSFNRTTRDGTNDPNSQTGFNQVLPTRYVSDSHQPGQRSYEARGWTEAPSGEKRPGKHDSLDHGVKYSERSLQTNEGVRVQKGFNSEGQSEDGLVSERRQMKFSSEGVGDKHATLAESHYRKPDVLGKVKEAGISNSFMGYFSNRSPNGRGSLLRREHSDLELGEFREPFHDETPGPKKQFERKSSFKQSDDNPVNSECWNSDFSRGKPPNKVTGDSGKLSPPNSEAAVSGIPGGPSKRKDPEHYVDDLARPHHKGTRPLHQHHQPWGDHIEVGLQHNKAPELFIHQIREGGPELKGPIKDASQDEFSKLGKDLEAYKGRDMKRYCDILEQMRSSFRQCGEVWSRLVF